jgi:hypothetical protein
MNDTPDPDRLVDVDFESYYDDDLSITVQGVHGYVDHPQFDAYSVALKTDDGEWAGHPKDAPWEWCHGTTFVAHNVGFDELVFRRLQKDGIIPKDIEPAKFVCSADLSVWCSAKRALNHAAKALVDMKVDKSMRRKMKGKTLAQAEAAGLGKEAKDYVMGDAVASFMIAKKWLPKWPEREQRVSNLIRQRGDNGVRVDVGYVDEAIKHYRKLLFEAEQHIPWDWESTHKTPLAAKYVRAECRKAGITCPSSFAKDDEDCIIWENKYADRFSWVKALRDWRRTNMSLTKFSAIRIRVRDDGTMPYRIKYMGAHTGRMSGDGGFNVQNMDRDPYEGFHLRNAFIPRKGKVFGVLDYSQIEPRLLLYKNKDEKQLDLVRNGLEVYEAHARATMNYTRPEELAVLADPNSPLYDPLFGDIRRLSKARVIGLGYGCGVKKFVTVAQIMAGLTITEEESKSIVHQYRADNPRVTYYWAEHDKWLKWSVSRKDDTHEIPLLSGRVLTYFNPKFLTKEFAGEKKSGIYAQTARNGPMLGTWGGKLTENDIQAEGYDVLVDGMLRLDDNGIPPLWTIHDEFVMEFDEDHAEEQMAEAQALLEIAPEWLPNFPLAVSGGLTDRYCKM